ncbi:MAG: phosphate regulon sensor histidine kinase PhoR [Sulfuritalea sp.]|nr:phosphate regulon sensor histidine kinase PhoR [Sulfuritalea sp.]
MTAVPGTAFSWLLLALVIVLALILLGQLRQRNALRDWLNAPDNPIPDGSGVWCDLFSRLQRLRREEERRHDATREALERFRSAAEALPDGVMLLGRSEHIEWLNPAACRHFSLDASRDIGISIEQLIRDSAFLAYLRAFRDGRATEPLQLQRGPGEAVLALSLIPFAGTGTLLLSHDVTELAHTETIRRDFVANVSHELRTPLTVITGFLEQFASERPPTGEAARSFFGLMTEQTIRMNRLVDDLLTLSRLENDSQPPRDDPIDVPALIDSLLAEAGALSGGRHDFRAGTVHGRRLRGSYDEIRSAFGNLVSNAVRYTPSGGTITLDWVADAEVTVFSVTDTGIGIPPEHLPRLSERFYRVDKGRSTASGGTGLGLAIVKHVLARHGGTLQIHSTPGRGSKFSARLPAGRLI